MCLFAGESWEWDEDGLVTVCRRELGRVRVREEGGHVTACMAVYRIVGNFRGYKYFAKQAKVRDSEIFAVLIFAVSESGTRGLASCRAKS